MTSLIFGSIYMGHKSFIEHRREKQRVKNYERWEGLRDEYDEQKKITRQTRSLDIQRTGAYGGYPETGEDEDRGILTLRDQQEANDARTGWRPQESWEEPYNRRASVDVRPNFPQDDNMQAYATANATANANSRLSAGNWSESVRRQKTGSTWDAGLPEPLRVNRRTWDDGVGTGSGPGSGANSVREGSIPRRADTPHSHASGRQSVGTGTPNLSSQTTVPDLNAANQKIRNTVEDVEPIPSHVPGGRMAELIEFNNRNNNSVNPGGLRSVTVPSTFAPTTAVQQRNDEPAAMEEWWNRG